MHLEWKKHGGTIPKGCKNGVTTHGKGCCLCGVERKMDCKDVPYEFVPGKTDSKGDVRWDSSCIKGVMGEDKNNPNKVPLRIKVHTGAAELELVECRNQDEESCGGATCSLVPESRRSEGCDCWDCPHKPPCRRRAGCKSRNLPVPIPDEEGPDEDFDDEPPLHEEFDLDLDDVDMEFV